jgi:hypothetical protein
MADRLFLAVLQELAGWQVGELFFFCSELPRGGASEVVPPEFHQPVGIPEWRCGLFSTFENDRR